MKASLRSSSFMRVSYSFWAIAKEMIHLIPRQKFAKNWHILPPDRKTFIGKFCLRTKWMNPKGQKNPNRPSCSFLRNYFWERRHEWGPKIYQLICKCSMNVSVLQKAALKNIGRHPAFSFLFRCFPINCGKFFRAVVIMWKNCGWLILWRY